MYGSTQTHSIGSKSALLLGMPIRILPVKAEDGYALRGDVLQAAIEEDIRNGFTPFFVSEWGACAIESSLSLSDDEARANTQSAQSARPPLARSTTSARSARSVSPAPPHPN